MIYARVLVLMAAAIHCYAAESECVPQTTTNTVLLGTAGSFSVLAKTGITNVVPSTVTGDMGVSPIAAASITGFDLVMDSSGVFSTSSQVTGSVIAANYKNPSPTSMTTAVSDMEIAYTDAASRSSKVDSNQGSGDLSGLTLTPGVYTFTRDINLAAAKEVTLTGKACDVFIFQTTGSLNFGSAAYVKLAGGIKASNIFWQVAGFVSVGTTAHVEGTILSYTDITMKTKSTLNGRMLSQTFVALQMVDIDEDTTAKAAANNAK